MDLALFWLADISYIKTGTFLYFFSFVCSGQTNNQKCLIVLYQNPLVEKAYLFVVSVNEMTMNASELREKAFK